MVLGEDEPQRHVVVFDVNIYLDIADVLGPPFDWDSFHAAAAREAKSPVPHPSNRALDSLRAVALCESGRFAGPETLEVWTNSHIDGMVRSKAMQSMVPEADTGYRGLGWEEAHAQGLVDVLVQGITSSSAGGTLGDHFPDGNPPLDHEDGKVFGACRLLAGDDPLCTVYCVTRDGGFLGAYQRGQLPRHTKVISPGVFVELVRRSRASYSIKRMPGPASQIDA